MATFKDVQNTPELDTAVLREMVTVFQTKRNPDAKVEDVDALKLYKAFARTLRRLRNLKLDAKYDNEPVTIYQKLNADKVPELGAQIGDLAFAWTWTKDGKSYVVKNTATGETLYDGVKWNEARSLLAPVVEKPVKKAAAPKKPKATKPAKKAAPKKDAAKPKKAKGAPKKAKAVKAVKNPVPVEPAPADVMAEVDAALEEDPPAELG